MPLSEFPSLIVCGSQIGIPDAAYLSRLWCNLIHDADLLLLKRALEELSELWCLMVEKDARLERLSASAATHSLAKWANSGDSTALRVDLGSSTARNTHLAVLTVLAHILEYTHHLTLHDRNAQHESIAFEDAHRSMLQAVEDGGIQGLCIGMLSATALACSRTKTELATNGAVAIRLAMCIGAYIDLDSLDTADSMVSVAVRWPPGEEDGQDLLDKALASLPEAYVTVSMDVSCATITAPRRSVPSFVSHFEHKRGYMAKQIDLQGRFHHPAHQDSLERLLQLCAVLPLLQFCDQSVPQVPSRRKTSGELVKEPDASLVDEPSMLHEVALRCILVEKANWYGTIKTSADTIERAWSSEQQPKALLLGPVDCVPHSVPLQVCRPWLPRSGDQQLYTYPDHAVAVVGASGRFPGSETLEEFWETIRSKKSTDGPMPERKGYGTDSGYQEAAFKGNYLTNSGSFDHAFFRKSPREAAYMDPQHRLALHLAYEALESSGYYSPTSSETQAPDDVGCYIGVSSADYHENVNAQPATAFSFTGTARAFAPGRISHFFGWTGPSLAIDTACSSSMVAVHTAARAIQSGECSMALAGGLNLITTPKSHQSLGGASFLSASGGQCRPFDIGANGYCRGEAAGFVLLKKLSAAVADNDHILGVIVGSATNSSKGNNSITVPSPTSQSNLYRRVLKIAGMQPSQVSYVEAHGTGTQKGDPVEFESIRDVFGGKGRKLRFGSVKGNIGHSESASGVASLIKSLLMLQHGQIPPQASFDTLNPALGLLEDADMEIPQQLQPWDVPFRAACVNNYGASGSNAVMIVCQPPPPSTRNVGTLAAASPRYPFLVSAQSNAALQRCCRALVSTIERYEQQRNSSHTLSEGQFLSSIAFNLAQKQNHTLNYRATVQAGSLSELKACLSSEITTGEVSRGFRNHHTSPKPVVLVFAGQTGHRPRLSQEAYQGSLLLQRHLDRCDRVLQSLGLRSLFPDIFEHGPIDALGDIHCMQFSIQYAAASAWIDAGLEIKKVVGHSLGQLTALCVSGAISLRDGLKLVSGRAALIQTNWGPERGCMVSVDADIATVQSLLLSTPEQCPDGSGDSDGGSDTRLEIACYNSASNHVVVGSESAIARLEHTAHSSKIRSTRLPISHGFHSHMVDSIMEDFSELVRGIKFSPPRIELEACATMPFSWAEITPELVARQSREPVYFSDAVARVQDALGPSCIWLEAGSGPVGVTMVRRALESHGASSGHSFYSLRLHIPGAVESLAATTLSLWKERVRVQFWLFHAVQRGQFEQLKLPAYQFEDSHHWLPLPSSVPKDEMSKQPKHRNEDQYKQLLPTNAETSSQLVSFTGFQGQAGVDALTALFSINQHVDEYSTMVHARTVLGHNLTPSSVWLESAGRALRLLSSSSEAVGGLIQTDCVSLHAPFGLDLARRLRLTLRKQEPEAAGWYFEVESYSKNGNNTAKKLHASGTIRLQAQHDQAGASQPGSYGRMLGRLIDHKRCQDICQDPEASLVQGSFVRKLLSRIAAYTPESFGIKSIAMKDVEAVSRITLPRAAATSLENDKMTSIHPLVHDNVLLVAEMHASNLEQCPSDEVYICDSMDAVIPMALSKGPWTVYSKLHHRMERKACVVSDIFVFNDLSRKLELVILGANFCRIRMRSLERVLSEMPGDAHHKALGHDIRSQNLGFDNDSDLDSGIELTGTSQLLKESQSFPFPSTESRTGRKAVSTQFSDVDTKVVSSEDVRLAVVGLVGEITACVPDTRIDDTTCLSSLGLDSLSATELQARVKEVFLIDLPLRRLLEEDSLTLGRLCQEIESKSRVLPDALTSSTSSLGSGPSGVDGLGHLQTKAPPAPISNGDNQSPESDKEVISRLSKLLAENLDFQEATSIDRQVPLGDMGLDSLVAIQLKSDIHELFGRAVGEKLQLGPETTFENLCHAVLGHTSTKEPIGIAAKPPASGLHHAKVSKLTDNTPQPSQKQSSLVRQAPAELQRVNESYHVLAQEVRMAGFYASGAHQMQLNLVSAYITEAFSVLGCDLAKLEADEKLPAMTYLPKYQKLVTRYYDILAEAGLIVSSDGCEFRRTSKPLDSLAPLAENLHSEILCALPDFSPEHRLLHVTAPHLADCMSGTKEPLALLFSDKMAKQLLTDTYVESPLFASGNRVLGEFLSRIIPHHEPSRKLQILEIGGGTGGTTHLVLQKLIDCGVDFEYTFTDISAGLVATTKRAFTVRYGAEVAESKMKWTMLNVEEAPPADMLQRHDVIISANCIHATKDLDVSCANIRRLLRPEGGMLCLVELTRPQAWLDCVFGLLDGWWRFEDARTYALADERQWDGILRKAGFFHVGWSDDESRESDQIRLIVALGRD